MSNDDPIRNPSKIGDESMKLAEEIAREIAENGTSNVDELPGIKQNLDLLITNERLMKNVIWRTTCEVNLLEESGLGDPATNTTYEAKISKICRACRNNLLILKATRKTTVAEDRIANLESLIQKHEKINAKVQYLVLKFTQHQPSGGFQVEQEKREPFDDEFNTLCRLMKQESITLIINPDEDGVRRESSIYFHDTGKSFNFREEIIYMAMLTVHRFLEERVINKKRLEILRCACLSIAVKVNQNTYNEVEELLNRFKSKGIDSEKLARMEWSIMSALKWNIRVVTPFDISKIYLPRLCAHYSLAESRIDAIRMKSGKIMLNVVREGKLLKYKPSQIAVAATVLALDDTSTVEAFEALPLLGLFETADLFKRYEELRDLYNSG